MPSHQGLPRDPSNREPSGFPSNPRDWVRLPDWDRDLVQHSRDLLCVHDLSGRLLSVNPLPARVLGYSVDEILQIPMRDLVAPEFRDQFEAYLDEIQRTGKSDGLLAVMTRTGQRRVWEYHNTLRTEGVEIPVVRGIAHDVTERVKAEKALRDAVGRLQEFERVVESLDEMIVVVDREHRYILANQAFLLYRGISREDVIGQHVATVLHPDAYETAVKPKLDECFRGKIVNYEMKYEYPELGTRDLSITYLPVESPSGIDRVACVLRDFTERKQAADLLEKSERRLRAVHERAPVGIALLDSRSGRFLQVNAKFCEIAGRTEEEMLQLGFRDITHPEDLADGNEELRQLVEERTTLFDIEKRYVRPDGTPVWVSLSVVPMWKPGEEARWHMAIAQDITQRRQAEQALRESEERLRLAQEAARIGAFERNFLTGESQWTPQMEAIYGLSPGGFPRTVDKFLELVHPADRQQVERLVAQSMELGEAKGEWRVVWPDGTVHWISGRWRVFKDASGNPARAIGIDFDITERKQAEVALRASQLEQFEIAKQLERESARLIEAQAVGKVGSWEVELPSLKISWSEQTHRIFETDPSRFHPTRPDFVKLVHPDDRAKVDAAFEASLEKNTASTMEYRTVLADGRVKVLEERWKVFHDERGMPVRLVGTCQDITERKQVEEELRRAKERLTEEKLYLEQEIDTELGFEDIVGKSAALKRVMESVAKVAATDATVLLLGETGTGKELIARAIHRLSRRAGNAFIKMNCAAIPSGLLESELFGAEKGAYTGAVGRKIGRLELADKGTIFLDEIGEISLALQPKLLRVLQDQEFERLGGTKTLRVDFRLIAATNRDLGEAMREYEFRSDLYYRLNVFPISIPPLRERRDDIPLLVEHFVQKIARRMNKGITSIPKKTMDALAGSDWPGNVRELENFIERSVILTNGSVLTAALTELRPAVEEFAEDDTLKAKEREYILRALRESRGQISGPRGAAARLGLKRTTLQSKIKSLGIHPRVPPQGSP